MPPGSGLEGRYLGLARLPRHVLDYDTAYQP